MLRPAMLARFLLCSVVGLVFSACAPKIGDECKTALDCSSQGSRLCDRTQPHGYCTIKGCESGTCPEEAVCVKFRPRAERLAVTYCMLKCDGQGDCRGGEGYECTSAKDFGTGNGRDAEIVRASGDTSTDSGPRFCAVPALESVPESGDGDMSIDEDAGGTASMSIDDDAGSTR